MSDDGVLMDMCRCAHPAEDHCHVDPGNACGVCGPAVCPMFRAALRVVEWEATCHECGKHAVMPNDAPLHEQCRRITAAKLRHPAGRAR